ncbi:uncharacterized protein LOC115261853, partial [Aedes albopictus]|uniref:Ubiquitin-like protease family profile domain-containing protein n=1 Tax=Aedes albopictus TaxID=7160 RepID=A0ABM1XLZ4_AEDAL
IFRFLQSYSVGPFRIILISCDQLKILHQERLRYVNDTSTEKPPRFLVETDATGGMCAPIKNLNCDKRIDNYAIVKSVGIPGDVSSKTVMSFGDMITNDHSSYNIGIFYREFKHKFEEEFKYWPPFDGIVTDKCWAQMKSIIELNDGLDVVSYLNLMHRYTTEADQKLVNYVNKRYVLCFLCIVHLSKNFLKDVKSMLGEARDRQAAKIFFVEMVHASNYTVFKNIFEMFCTYFLSKKISEREECLHSLKYDSNYWEAIEADESVGSGNSDSESDAIYSNSMWYKDCATIYERKLKMFGHNTSSKNTLFVDFVMQHYVALTPLWTGILHNETVQSVPPILSKFICSTNNVECHWSNTKEAIRSKVIEVGKMPLPAERLIGLMKTQTKANVIRYRSNIPKGRLNARKGTFRRKIRATTKQTTVSSDLRQTTPRTPAVMTLSKLGETSAEWGRTPGLVSAAKKKIAKQSRKRLFDRSFKDLSCFKIPTQEEFTAKAAKAAQQHNGRRLYFGRNHFQHRSITVDVDELETVINGWLVDSVVEWLIAAEITAAGLSAEYYLLQPYAASILFDQKSQNQELMLMEYRRMVSKNRIIVPFCDGIHYYLIFIDFVKRLFCCWDSQRKFASKTASHFFEVIRKVGDEAGDRMRWAIEVEEWTVEDRPCTQQTDNESCGIFTIEFSKILLKGESNFNINVNPKQWRSENYRKLYLECYHDFPSCTLCGQIENENFAVVCKDCPFKLCKVCVKESNRKCIICP